MKVITAALPLFRLVPRFYPDIEDELLLVFENEMEIDFEWSIDKNMLAVILLDTSLMQQRENYSFTLLLGNEILYKGKLIFLKNGTDVQNYTNQSQDNKRWKE